MKYMQPTSTTSVPATKISLAFEQARHEGQSVLIPYFMCGYPSAAQSVELVLAAAQGGADIIELGMPFSDPLADGATIQQAGHVALEGGMTINGCMQVARQVAAKSAVPLLLMGYYNPLLAYGIKRFCQVAAESGVCGLIIPDLPPEEALPLQEAAQQYGLALVFLVPPTTFDERIAQIVQSATSGYKGFLYCVSLSGVTGSRTALPTHLRGFIARVRKYTQDHALPIAVGFGLSTPEHVAEVTSYAEGAVIGSALVNLIDKYPPSEQTGAVRKYIESLRGR
ncbi:MAG: tryptophan synthase subunit alpha [Ktedonobacteraceae bacterium]